jgi:chromosome partitioning protein
MPGFGTSELPEFQETTPGGSMTAETTAASGPPSETVNARTTDAWVIAIPNQKGGVGKTTMALALAAVTADANGRALVVDVDPQSSSAEQAERMTDPGFDFTHELDPEQLRRIRQLRDYDMVFVDCPGSLEGFQVLDTVLRHSHFAVIPFENDPLAVRPTVRTARFCAERGVTYRVLLNNVDPRLGADEVRTAWALLDEGQLDRFRCFVRGYRAFPNALATRQTITQYRGKYAVNVRDDIRRVHTELLIELGRIANRG